MSKFTMPQNMMRPTRTTADDAAEAMRIKRLVKQEFTRQFEEQEKQHQKELAHMGYYTFDLVFQACLLTLIDDFGFGTREYQNKSGRLRRLSDKMQEYLGEYCARYDDYISDGLREQLRQRGLEYHSLEMQHKDEWR